MWLRRSSDGKYITYARVQYVWCGERREEYHVKLGYWRDEEVVELVTKNRSENEQERVIEVTRIEVFRHGHDTLIDAFAALATEKTESLLSCIITAFIAKKQRKAK